MLKLSSEKGVLMDKTVVELFAGVGGFRVGLNNISSYKKNGKAVEKGNRKFLWANQREPSTKAQDAFNCYNTRFPSSHNSNIDIAKINKADIPNHTLLVGGFPCQDYSVARSLSNEKGIEGKKGVLWWQIRDILEIKKPPFVLLENVDRLLKSPSKQRGRDFGIILKCFYDLGYSVEWRVVNAAEYGHCQRRRRTYIFACRVNTSYFKNIKNFSPDELLLEKGLYAKVFPVEKNIEKIFNFDISSFKDLPDLSQNFKANFENSGFMIDGKIYTAKLTSNGPKAIPLSDLIQTDKVDPKYFLDNVKSEKFKYLRGSKKILRKNKTNGHEYYYSEGSMSPYDKLSSPGRTMLTSEGTVNRSSHLILDPLTEKLRILTPIECERLNEFPDNWTNTGMSEKRRYFMMGNALVCGIISQIGRLLEQIVESEE